MPETSPPRVLTEAELRQVVGIDQAAFAAIESAFGWLEGGRVNMPPIMHIVTDLRTGLAGAVAGKFLAPPAVETVGVLGTGTQARYQVRCLRLVRDFRKVVVWGRDRSKAERYAAEMRADGYDLAVADSMEACVKACEVLITVTASEEPLVRADWIRAGQHVTAAGLLMQPPRAPATP